MSLVDPKQYIPQLSIDCVVFGYKDKELKVLIAQLNLGDLFFALPGGFIRQNQSIENAALQILEDRTGIKNIYLDQFMVFGQEKRINTGIEELLNNPEKASDHHDFLSNEMLLWLSKRFVSIGFYALVDINKVNPRKGEIDQNLEWYNVDNIPDLIMDHNYIMDCGLEVLRLNLDKKLIGFNLLPEIFTMRELKELYEAVYDKPFARNNFQKKILDLNVLERLDKKYTGAANKAPYLYRFKH